VEALLQNLFGAHRADDDGTSLPDDDGASLPNESPEDYQTSDSEGTPDIGATEAVERKPMQAQYAEDMDETLRDRLEEHVVATPRPMPHTQSHTQSHTHTHTTQT
jgi:hypothetical protein